MSEGVKWYQYLLLFLMLLYILIARDGEFNDS